MNVIEPISILSVPLAIKSYNGILIGAATGFFWRKSDGRTYLVSNYHVMSGNHYLTGESINRDSAFPARIEYPRLISHGQPHERALHSVLLCDEAGNDCRWKSRLIHEDYPVDLAIIEVPSIADDSSYVHAVNDEPRRECDKPLPRYQPGFELMIAGFFLRDRPTGYFPIYIKGSVASEMDALYNGKKAFLIDALTSSGMSGSPVFTVGWEQEDPSQEFGLLKTIPRFVGVYSGRIIENENGKERELQVGIVWRRELIRETVDSA